LESYVANIAEVITVQKQIVLYVFANRNFRALFSIKYS